MIMRRILDECQTSISLESSLINGLVRCAFDIVLLILMVFLLHL